MMKRGASAYPKSSRHLVATAGWATLMSLTLGLILIHPTAVAPLAEAARGAAWALLEGEAGRGQILDLVLYAAMLLFPPLIVLAGYALIETLVAGNRPPRASDRLVWPVQLTFALAVLSALTLFGLADIPPAPRFHAGLSSGSFLDWIELILLYFVAVIVAEVGYYWIHRALHRFAWLWKFHAVHHSQHDLDVMHGIIHPVEHVIRLMVVAVPLGFLVRFDQVSLCVLVALLSLQNKITHMRAPIHFGPFGKILADNRYHFIHHSRDPADHNSNFSDRFPFIDMLFGTYRAPRDVLPETGLGDRTPPSSLAQYVLAICPEQRGISRP